MTDHDWKTPFFRTLADAVTFVSCSAALYALAYVIAPWSIHLVNFLWAVVGVVVVLWIWDLFEHVLAAPAIFGMLYLFVGLHLGLDSLLFINSVFGSAGLCFAFTTTVVSLAHLRDRAE